MAATEQQPQAPARLLDTDLPSASPSGRHQQVAARTRPLPSCAAAALLISMVLLASVASTRVAARSLSASALGGHEFPRGARGGAQSAASDKLEPTAASELDLESATISHPAASLTSRAKAGDKLHELNESLRALNKMVGESRLPPLGAESNASELADEPEDDYTSASSGEESLARAVAVKQSLVRQLSDLMMNHDEPETIARSLGTHSAEERARRRARQLEAATDSLGPATSAGGESTGGSLQASDGQSGPPGEHNLLPHADEELITCPPDYDDRSTLLVPTNISELFGESYASNASALTEEQRQQLLRGADGSALAAAGSADGASGELNETALLQQQLEWQQQQQHRHMQLRPACRSAGMTRIELITKRITPILFCIIIVIGLVGNIVVMLVILEERKLERELTPTNLLILDLSLADLSFIIFCIPFTGWDYATGYWAFGSLWCKLNQYLIVVCALSSIYTLVLMSCDRFMAIVYPIECISYRTSRNMMQAIVIKWIVILLAASPAIEMHGLISSPFDNEPPICRFLADQYNPLHFQIVFFLTSYLFPLVLIFGLYLSLLNKLWFGQRPQGHKESHKMLESKKKVTWLVASIVIVFAVCWCPIQIMLILMRLKTIEITATYVAIQVFAHTLGYMNSCVNPIVYAFASETFYQSFRRSYLARLFCCTPSSLYYANNNGLSHTNNNNNNNSTTLSNANHSGRAHNFKQFTHHPNALTLTTHLNSNQHKLAPRSSLQITPTDGGVHHGNTSNANHRNTSLNHIFEQQAAGGASGSPRDPTSAQARAPPASSRPPLEPRDRDQAISPPPPQLAVVHRPPAGPSAELGAKVGSSPANPPPSAESTNPAPAGTKQQLVARVVRQSSGTANQVVAHQCEPCEPEY